MSVPSQLHVLFVPSWFPTAYNPTRGIFFLDQAKAVSQAGVKTGILYPDLRSLRTARPSAVLENHFQLDVSSLGDIPTVSLKAWNVPVSRAQEWLFVCSTIRLYEAYVRRFGDPDLVHAQSVIWGGAGACRLSKEFGIPFLISEHYSGFVRGSLSYRAQSRAAEVFAHAERIFPVSSALRSWLEPYLEGVPDTRVDVIPNMVDTSFFTLPPDPRSDKVFRFLSVGSLEPVKGMDMVIRSFARLPASLGEVELVIAGDGSMRSELESIARSLNVANRIEFRGWLSRDEVRDAMWHADAFVLASHYETFGVVLIEAMSAGLPVIATRCGGPEEIIYEDVGRLVELGATEQMTSRMLELATAEASQFRSDRIRAYAKARFGARTVAEQLKQVYESLLCEQSKGGK